MMSKLLALRILGLIDLTSLEDTDDAAKIEALAHKGMTRFGPVAALCVYPRLVSAARHALGPVEIPIATVVNFPTGTEALEQIKEECRLALESGAAEIDLVYPYQQHLHGDGSGAEALVDAIRTFLPKPIKLKVILETGAHPDSRDTLTMADASLRAGADFLKTSTGKIAKGASLEAVSLLLNRATSVSPPVGVKASGGIRTLEDASQYLDLADKAYGLEVTRDHFRFGASGLLDDVLRHLGDEPIAPGRSSGY